MPQQLVKSGWAFCTADFSMQAAGKRPQGSVMLIRSPEQAVLWHQMPADLKDAVDGPPLYVSGAGNTVEEAIESAYRAAAGAKPIPIAGGRSE